MVKGNLVDFILWTIIIFFIGRGFILKASSKSLEEVIFSVECSIIFLISIILSININQGIFLLHKQGLYSKIYSFLPDFIVNLVNGKPLLVYILFMPLLTLILYKLFKILLTLINSISVSPILKGVEKISGKGFLRRVLGSIFEIPRALIYVILICFCFRVASFTNIFDNLEVPLKSSKIYNVVNKNIIDPITNSSIAKNLPYILSNALVIKEEPIEDEVYSEGYNKPNVIVYYNGTTLEEAVKGNEEITTFINKLVSKEHNDFQKAHKIYKWITKEMIYDNDKASKVMSSDYTLKSGAISAFENKSGICFDFSALYVAMCRAVNLKVRLITGEGYDGNEWISHSWNEVYIPSMDKWVDVDTTFGLVDNYFNSKNFRTDHRNSKIAGEWD